MKDETPSQRIAVIWSPEARSDLRVIEYKDENIIEITGVRNRREAYR